MELPVVLITGCSSGIGRDLARRLTGAGYRVVATARHPERLNDLGAALTLPLDVQDPVSVTGAVERVLAAFGRIDVLVNNAGYSQIGPLEEVDDAHLQQVFDVNVFGPLRLVRAVLSHMRRQKSGRIIQVSSIAGWVAMPLSGAYCGTKFALEGVSDSLRLELRPFGIRVVLVEPGAIRTKFEETLRDRARIFTGNSDSPYWKQYAARERLSDRLLKDAPGPEIVSSVIQGAIESPHPKARYAVPVGQTLPIKIARLLPDPWRDRLVASMFEMRRSV
jgi:NAD(P)-dependent dehydrogenase (short-subunit alcohol dehydrogenase family)